MGEPGRIWGRSTGARDTKNSWRAAALSQGYHNEAGAPIQRRVQSQVALESSNRCGVKRRLMFTAPKLRGSHRLPMDAATYCTGQRAPAMESRPAARRQGATSRISALDQYRLHCWKLIRPTIERNQPAASDLWPKPHVPVRIRTPAESIRGSEFPAGNHDPHERLGVNAEAFGLTGHANRPTGQLGGQQDIGADKASCSD